MVQEFEFDYIGIYNQLAHYLRGLKAYLTLYAQHPTKHGQITNYEMDVWNGYRYLKPWIRFTNLQDQFGASHHFYVFGTKLAKQHKFDDAKKVLTQAADAVPAPSNLVLDVKG